MLVFNYNMTFYKTITKTQYYNVFLFFIKLQTLYEYVSNMWQEKKDNLFTGNNYTYCTFM